MLIILKTTGLQYSNINNIHLKDQLNAKDDEKKAETDLAGVYLRKQRKDTQKAACRKLMEILERLSFSALVILESRFNE